MLFLVKDYSCFMIIERVKNFINRFILIWMVFMHWNVLISKSSTTGRSFASWFFRNILCFVFCRILKEILIFELKFEIFIWVIIWNWLKIIGWRLQMRRYKLLLIFSDCWVRPHTSNHPCLPSPDWPAKIDKNSWLKILAN